MLENNNDIERNEENKEENNEYMILKDENKNQENSFRSTQSNIE